MALLLGKIRLPDPSEQYERRNEAEFRRLLETSINSLAGGIDVATGGGGGGATTLNDLTDVDTTGVVASMFLRYSGTEWIAESVAFPQTLAELQDYDGSPAPTDNQVLTYNSGTSKWEPQDAAGGSAEFQRSDKVITTASLAVNATENSSIDISVSAAVLLRVQADRACRVRLYSTAAARTADASRAVGVDPDPGEGLLCEYVFTSTELDETADPTVILKNMDSPVDTNIYYAIENRSAGASTVTCTLTVIESVLALAAVPAATVTAGTFGSGNYTFPGDLTVSGGNLNMGGTSDAIEFTTPYHLIRGGTNTTPCRFYVGSNSDPAIYLDSNALIYFRDLSSNTRFLFNLGATPTLALNGTQVLTIRRTGWGSPTGTTTRTAFDTATVTVAQLAERVKALIEDLKDWHGIIGA